MNFYCTSATMAVLAILLLGCNDQPPSADSIPTPKPGAIPLLVEDVDGKTYRTVQIGDQVWLAENLRTTRYRNGDEIPYAHANDVCPDEIAAKAELAPIFDSASDARVGIFK